jgi:hypothetical protein
MGKSHGIGQILMIEFIKTSNDPKRKMVLTAKLKSIDDLLMCPLAPDGIMHLCQRTLKTHIDKMNALSITQE